MTDFRTLTGAGGIISAAHRSAEGVMHGHTWEVTAWWSGLPDAAQKQIELVRFLEMFDHTVLEHELEWAESLAEEICRAMGCEKVEVSRPLERLFATVELTQ